MRRWARSLKGSFPSSGRSVIGLLLGAELGFFPGLGKRMIIPVFWDAGMMEVRSIVLMYVVRNCVHGVIFWVLLVVLKYVLVIILSIPVEIASMPAAVLLLFFFSSCKRSVGVMGCMRVFHVVSGRFAAFRLYHSSHQ